MIILHEQIYFEKTIVKLIKTRFYGLPEGMAILCKAPFPGQKYKLPNEFFGLFLVFLVPVTTCSDK